MIYIVVFGFNKGATDLETATTTGKKVMEHHCSIARKLLIDGASGR
jgi:hypothetical protein